MYNLTNYTTSTNLLDMAIVSNNLTGGILTLVMLFGFLIVAFIFMRNTTTAGNAFIVVSFMGVIMSYLLMIGNLLDAGFFFILLVVFGLSVLFEKVFS